jgi:hypothetical protein
MKELELAYVGMINKQLDNQLIEEVPSILKQLGVEAEWDFQECSVGTYLPHRNMGWNLSRELSEYEKIEFNYGLDIVFDNFVKIIRI